MIENDLKSKKIP